MMASLPPPVQPFVRWRDARRCSRRPCGHQGRRAACLGRASTVIPLIGISTYVAEAAWGAWSRPSAVLPESYYELVASAGARPMLLPPLRTSPSGPGFGATEV